MSSDNPFISVVTPSLNQGCFIRSTIESVLGQGRNDIEHIIVDGGSTDETLDIIQNYSHLRWISEPDRGQSDALNKGIGMAEGEWIAWINADDYLFPEALNKLAAFAGNCPEAQFVFSNCTFVDGHGTVVETKRASYDPRSFFRWWREGGAGFGQPGSFFKKELRERFGPFDPDLHYMMDYDFWLRLSETVRFYYLDEALAAYRLHRQAKTSRGWQPFVEEGMLITRRYWKERGGIAAWRILLPMHLMYATQLMTEGMRLRESGKHREARQCWRQAWRRCPLLLISFTHLRYRLRQMIGPRAYAALSRHVPWFGRLEQVFKQKVFEKI